MQIKSLVALATLFAAVSAADSSTSSSSSTTPKAFESNACSTCTLGSFAKESSCASLSTSDQTLLGSVFANNTVSIPNLIIAVNSTAVKNCICHWATGTFLPSGAAASCTLPGANSAPAACNATQVQDATTQMAPLSGVIHCDAVVSNTTGATPPANTGSASGNAGSVVGMSNLVGVAVVVATTAMGLGAMVGF